MEAGGRSRRKNADAATGCAASDVPSGPVRRLDDAGGVGEEDGVSGGKYFGANAPFAEGGTRRLAGAEEEKGVGRGAEDEYTGTSVGVPAEGIVASG